MPRIMALAAEAGKAYKRAMSHSVHQHLGVHAEDYDASIRKWIPHYEEMLATGVELLRRLARPGARVLDLGGGTGALSQAILAGVPAVEVELVDVDPEMLARARERLAFAGSRASFRRARFQDPLPRAGGVVASLALHHVHDAREKAGVYRAIREALLPGAPLLVLDATVSADRRIAALTYDSWAASMAAHGIPDAEARRLFGEWGKEDRYLPLHEELRLLAEAGFEDPECFWRRGPMTIYGGVTRSGTA